MGEEQHKPLGEGRVRDTQICGLGAAQICSMFFLIVLETKLNQCTVNLKGIFILQKKVLALFKPQSRKLEGDKPPKIDQSEKVPNQSYKNAGSAVPGPFPTLPPDSGIRGIGTGRSLGRRGLYCIQTRKR